MCLLLENVGGSEQNRSVIANVQSDNLWPSRITQPPTSVSFVLGHSVKGKGKGQVLAIALLT